MVKTFTLYFNVFSTVLWAEFDCSVFSRYSVECSDTVHVSTRQYRDGVRVVDLPRAYFQVF